MDVFDQPECEGGYVTVNEKYFTEGSIFYGYDIINLDQLARQDST
ncbi:hypothetical protein [Kosakonia sacchari]|nr:hypothetical protein [Kosakonia sacchari]